MNKRRQGFETRPEVSTPEGAAGRKLVERVAERISTFNLNVRSWSELDEFQKNSWRKEAKQILSENNLYQKVKCPHCEWSQFQDGESVGMTPCYSCNSTGYIYIPLAEELKNDRNH